MNTRTSAANLAQAVKDLKIHWDEASTHWADAKSMQFENAYLEPLPHHAARAATVIMEIDVILRKVQSDCE